MTCYTAKQLIFFPHLLLVILSNLVPNRSLLFISLNDGQTNGGTSITSVAEVVTLPFLSLSNFSALHIRLCPFPMYSVRFLLNLSHFLHMNCFTSSKQFKCDVLVLQICFCPISLKKGLVPVSLLTFNHYIFGELGLILGNSHLHIDQIILSELNKVVDNGTVQALISTSIHNGQQIYIYIYLHFYEIWLTYRG